MIARSWLQRHCTNQPLLSFLSLFFSIPCFGTSTFQTPLQLLFLEPNPSDPLNKQAAKELRTDPAGFQNTVSATMAGAEFDGVKYDDVVGMSGLRARR